METQALYINRGMKNPICLGWEKMARWLIGLVWVSLLADAAYGQFLRLGPFDMTASAFLQGDYTTNVEGEWPDEATGETTDYYLTTGVDFLSKATVMRNTMLKFDTAFSVEKHFRRPDLDNSSNPFGKLKFAGLTELTPYLMLKAGAGIERASQSADDVYVPGDRKTRDVNDQLSYNLGLDFKRKSLRGYAEYRYYGERHKDPLFLDSDEDKKTMSFGVNWQPFRIIGFYYTRRIENTEMINNPDANDDKTTEEYGIDGQIPLMKKPRIGYSLGLKSIDDSQKEEDGGVKPTHTLTLNDDWNLHSTLRLVIDAQYRYQEDYDDDELVLTYGALLEHTLSRTAKQSLSARRTPVRTLSTTTKTDNTTIDYRFIKHDLFVYFLDLLLGVQYTRDVPKDELLDEENKWLYTLALSHKRELSRKLKRILSYRFTHETSNLQMTPMDEHRITLKYEYTF